MVRQVSCIILLVTAAVSVREVDGGERAGSDRWYAYSPKFLYHHSPSRRKAGPRRSGSSRPTLNNSAV